MKVLVDLTAVTERPSGARVRALELYTRAAASGEVELLAAVRQGAGLEEPLARAGAKVFSFPSGVPVRRRIHVLLHGPARRARRAEGVRLLALETLPLPIGTRLPMVVTVHDLRFLRPGLASPLRRCFGRTLLHRNLGRAAAVIAPSGAIREELCRAYPRLDPRRVLKVWNGAPPLPEASPQEARFLLKKLGVASPYFLCLGHLEARKNGPFLVESFHGFRSADPERAPISLVVAGAGDPGPLRRAWTRAAGRADAPGLRILGPVSVEARAVLLRHALAVVQPSLYEGFGLGVLEALAVGVPAAASRIPAHLEVAGPEGALFFDPGDRNEAVEALARLALDFRLREALTAAGLRRAACFSWDRSARILVRIWRGIVKDESPPGRG